MASLHSTAASAAAAAATALEEEEVRAATATNINAIMGQAMARVNSNSCRRLCHSLPSGGWVREGEVCDRK